MRKIYLTGKNGKDKFALVDDGDFDYLNQWKWQYQAGTGYAVRSTYRKGAKYRIPLLMHRDINKTPPGLDLNTTLQLIDWSEISSKLETAKPRIKREVSRRDYLRMFEDIYNWRKASGRKDFENRGPIQATA